jgi:hypothetical protein
MNSNYIDLAVPGTGPMGPVGAAPMQSLDFEKFNSSYDLSLRSISDLNLNPQPEGNVKSVFSDLPENREGIYAIETDRGDLYPTVQTQINFTGPQEFQSVLQDQVRPTMKETTLYAYDGSVAPVSKAQALYTQFIPQYAKINGKDVRIGGSSNYGLRAATEYSYFPCAATTGINNSIVQNPDAAIGKNTQPVPDFNVDGPGTYNGARPDGTREQNYRLITKPTTAGLKLNYNLETESEGFYYPVNNALGETVKPLQDIQMSQKPNNFSLLLNQPVDGIENRYTASYQIAPLLNNPLSVIWNPSGDGQIPAFYCNTNPQDFSYMNMKNLPDDTFIGGGYNDVWAPDAAKTSSNAYVLGIEKGIHNGRIEWDLGHNNRPGVIYDSEKALPATCYSGARSVDDLFMNDQQEINRAFPYVNNEYTTLGDPSAGYIKAY